MGALNLYNMRAIPVNRIHKQNTCIVKLCDHELFCVHSHSDISISLVFHGTKIKEKKKVYDLYKISLRIHFDFPIFLVKVHKLNL